MLTLSVLNTHPVDGVLYRLAREGIDGATCSDLTSMLASPYAAPLARYVAGPLKVDALTNAMVQLSNPNTTIGHEESDNLLLFLRELYGQPESPGSTRARALAGMLILAAAEGLAKRYRPGAQYPYLAVSNIRAICLPVARLLLAAGMYSGAATLALLLRQYILTDPIQRTLDGGRKAIIECNQIEAEHIQHVRGYCKDAAWLLHEGIAADPAYRLCVAGLFFALGDIVRVRAILRKIDVSSRGIERHVPSLGALTDLVEISAELVAVDPLLQGVWLVTLGQTKVDVSDDLRFTLRNSLPQVSSELKGWDKTFRKAYGISLSEAYAQGILLFLSGATDASGVSTFDEQWWKVLIEALKLPNFWLQHRNSLVRILQLYSLTVGPSRPLPVSDFIASFCGLPAEMRDDLREVATMSLSEDTWTTRRAQIGRSLAYDSAFQIEPERRTEPLATSLEILEQHRYAALRYWLAVISPLVPQLRGQSEQDAVSDDQNLIREYRELAFLATLQESPIYHRAYGEPVGKRLINVPEGERLQRLMHLDEQRNRWYEKTAESFPLYAALRTQGAASVGSIQVALGLTADLVEARERKQPGLRREGRSAP